MDSPTLAKLTKRPEFLAAAKGRTCARGSVMIQAVLIDMAFAPAEGVDMLQYLAEHHPALSKKVAACETVDHPSDPQIAAFAKKFFATVPPSAAPKH